MLKIRRSRDRLIFSIGILYCLGKTVFVLKQGPGCLHQLLDNSKRIQNRHISFNGEENFPEGCSADVWSVSTYISRWFYSLLRPFTKMIPRRLRDKDTLSALLALCVRNPSIIGEFSAQRSETHSSMVSLLLAWISFWTSVEWPPKRDTLTHHAWGRYRWTHHWTWSTSVQVMAWCLATPSRYLNQCRLIICEVLWHSPKMNLKNTNFILRPYHPGENESMLMWRHLNSHICVG